MKEDIFFLEEAYKEAIKAYQKDEVPVGAVVVKDNQIIGRGHNRRIEKKNAIYHAEIVAIEDACKNTGNWRLDGCSIYITVEPCVMCAGAIMQSRIDRVVFGAIDEKGGAVISKYNLFSDKKLPFRVSYDYIKMNKCSDILKNFFRKKREK
ncbi:MAG: nucleoside deaminase [Aquificota bacterium]|nr:MAG: nucleoside deaminase [Aquificota bacterium]